MDLDDGARRRTMLIYLSLMASLGGYVAILAMSSRQRPGGSGPATTGNTWFVLLTLLAAAVLAAGSWVAGRRLRSSAGKPVDRVRFYFLIRGCLAESVGLYGFLLGSLRAPLGQVAALFAIAFAAFAFFAPTREAWDQAIRVAESAGP